MAEFHTRHKHQGGSGYLIKIFGALIGLGLLIYLIWSLMNLVDDENSGAARESNVLLENHYYNLMYDNAGCQPVWASYQLNKDLFSTGLQDSSVSPVRDERISDNCHKSDTVLKDSGLWLVPPSHMPFNATALKEVSRNSNIIYSRDATILKAYTQWERAVLQWVEDKGELFITTGLTPDDQLFASVCTGSPPISALAVIFDQSQLVDGSLEKCFVSIDSVERLSRLDLFQNILTSDDETKVDRTLHQGEWPLNN